MCEQINEPRAQSISLKVCRSWFSVCPWTSWFCQKFLATRTSISRFICFVSNNYSSFCWYLWIQKFSKCGNGLILFKFLTTSTPCHGCEMLGIPSSHALIWDYDMQDHLPLQFQLRIDTADEPPNQIGYCSIRLFSCFRLYNAVSLSRLKQQNDWTWDSWPSRRSLASLRCVAAAWETQGHRLRSTSTWVPGLCTLEKDARSGCQKIT